MIQLGLRIKGFSYESIGLTENHPGKKRGIQQKELGKYSERHCIKYFYFPCVLQKHFSQGIGKENKGGVCFFLLNFK